MSQFTPSGSAGLPSAPVNITGAENPTITNVSMVTANTEYSYPIPDGTKQFLIRTRSGAELKIAYVALQSGTNFVTVSKGCFYGESELTTSGLTIYFQSPEAAQMAEIVSWV